MMNQIHRNHRTYNMNMGFIFECYRNIRFRGGEPLSNIARETRNLVNSPIPDTILTYTIYPSTNISDSPSTSELLSEDEIFQSTTSRVFHSGEENITCPINLEIIADGESITTIIHCQHVFKTISLFNWFRRSTVCPVCRHNLKVNTTHEETNTSTQNIPSTTGLQDLLNLSINTPNITPSNQNALNILNALLHNNDTITTSTNVTMPDIFPY